MQVLQNEVLNCCASNKTKTYQGQIFIPDDHIQLISKYYNGANLNLNFELPKDEDTNTGCGTKTKGLKLKKCGTHHQRGNRRKILRKCCRCNDGRSKVTSRARKKIFSMIRSIKKNCERSSSCKQVFGCEREDFEECSCSRSARKNQTATCCHQNTSELLRCRLKCRNRTKCCRCRGGGCNNSTGANMKDEEAEKIKRQASKIKEGKGEHASSEMGAGVVMSEGNSKDKTVYLTKRVSSLEEDDAYGKYWYHRPLLNDVVTNCEEWDNPVTPKVASMGRQDQERLEKRSSKYAGLCLSCNEPMCFVCKNYVCYCSCTKPNFIICSACSKRMNPREKRPCPSSGSKRQSTGGRMENEAMMFLLPMLASMQGVTSCCQSCNC